MVVRVDPSVVVTTTDEHIVEFRLYHEESKKATSVQCHIPFTDVDETTDVDTLVAEGRQKIVSDVQNFDRHCGV